MILDLGQFGGFLESTVNFSNAVVVAMLPYVSDVAKNLEVPLPQPVTQQQIVSGGPNPVFETRYGQMSGCGFRLKGGWVFGFHGGCFDYFESPHSFYTLQNPDEIPKFVGPVRMSKDEAVQMARATLTKLGISLEAVYAEQEPRIKMPPKSRTGIVPHYLIKWLDIRSSPDSQEWNESVEIEVNANAKRVEYIKIKVNSNLRRPWPAFDAKPVLRPKPLSANPDYAWKLLPIVLRAVDGYGQKLSLPVPRPLTMNHVDRFFVSDNGGWPHAELELTSGWRFIYRNDMINGFYAPDTLFDFDRHPIRAKEVTGKRKLSEADAVKLVRHTLAKLDYPTNLVLMHFKPKVLESAVPGIPRYAFWWNALNKEKDDLIAKVEAEVDMEKGEIKSLYFDNKALWGKGPLIDVPITPPSVKDNAKLGVPTPETQQSAQKPSARPFKPFAPPGKD